jgi:hypothetical protein
MWAKDFDWKGIRTGKYSEPKFGPPLADLSGMVDGETKLAPGNDREAELVLIGQTPQFSAIGIMCVICGVKLGIVVPSSVWKDVSENGRTWREALDTCAEGELEIPPEAMLILTKGLCPGCQQEIKAGVRH